MPDRLGPGLLYLLSYFDLGQNSHISTTEAFGVMQQAFDSRCIPLCGLERLQSTPVYNRSNGDLWLLLGSELEQRSYTMVDPCILSYAACVGLIFDAAMITLDAYGQ